MRMRFISWTLPCLWLAIRSQRKSVTPFASLIVNCLGLVGSFEQLDKTCLMSYQSDFVFGKPRFYFTIGSMTGRSRFEWGFGFPINGLLTRWLASSISAICLKVSKHSAFVNSGW